MPVQWDATKIKLLSLIGKKVLSVLFSLGEIIHLYLLSIEAILYHTVYWKNTIVEMEFIGVKSLPIVLAISASTGMVFSLQIAKIFATFGLSSQLGQGLALAFARELAPVLTGVVVAGRVGSAIAASIGSMKVTEQIEALEALSTDPIDYLIAPKLIAAATMLPLLVIFADLFGIFCGFALAVSYAHISANDIVSGILTFVSYWDFLGGLIKAFFFGLIIAGVGSYQGLHTSNGAVGVGIATTQSVVISSIAIFVSNYFLSMILYHL
ncbi:MAG TPA: ABC transporter permease [Firmicutes bacterium]|jgi:phospholipid/cholesterol/gamma-HCH transport system permease protein|nr:ABC transporter permease [Bacillota bacterium]